MSDFDKGLNDSDMLFKSGRSQDHFEDSSRPKTQEEIQASLR